MTGRFTLPATLVTLATLVALMPTTAAGRGFLHESYPLESSVEFHSALLHWMDSLAGLHGPGFTAGKTVPVHRREFVERLRAPGDADRAALQAFAEVRSAAASGPDPDALTRAFFSAGSLRQARLAAASLLTDEQSSRLDEALRHFAPDYRKIWAAGGVVREFLHAARRDPLRDELGRFLAELADFYGVPAAADPPPRIVFVPTPDGAGTHAQAIGRFLLVELRAGERLSHEVGPIVHENAHFLFARLDEQRKRGLRAAAGDEVWRVLHEALPTAVAQGVATERFAPDRFRGDGPWYHVAEIDRYARALHPLVRQTLEGGGRLDESFVRRCSEIYARINPRSP